MKKKILSLLLALALCLGLLPMAALADGGMTWSFDGGTLTVSGTGPMEKSTYDSYWLGAIGTIYGTVEEWPWSSTEYGLDGPNLITSVVIEEGITDVGERAFESCRNLTDVTIPDSVTGIGMYAFASCKSLTGVTIPGSVTGIGDSAFYNCTSLTSVTISNGVTEIGDCAFHCCDSLPSVTIPGSVTSISSGAFYRCDSLEDVYYAGTKAQWAAVRSSSFSGDLERAAIHCTDGVINDSSSAPETPEEPEAKTVQVSFNSNGGSSVSNKTVTVGETYGFLSTPTREGYTFDGWFTSGTGGNRVLSITTVTNEYDHTLYAHWTEEIPETPSPFTDVPFWAKQPVDWAVGKKITNGTGGTNFSPDDTCTVAHILTFLYRAKGGSIDTPAGEKWYTSPMNWAETQSLISGGDKSKPDAPCTRAMVVTYLWKLAGCPAEAYDGSFTDVAANAEYATAVAWAIKAGVTTGMGNGIFGPDTPCTRAQIVTFLYRAYSE